MSVKTHHLDDDHFHDHCGVFGVFNHAEAAKMAYLGLYALQHRGQESAGISTSDGVQIHTHKSMGHVQEIFTPDVIAQLPGRPRSATRATPPRATRLCSMRSRS